MIAQFTDQEHGGFFTTADDHEQLVARRKDLEDSPIPSGNSAAAFGLLRLALISGEGKYERYGLGVLRLLFRLAARHPQAFGHLLQAADFYLAPVREVAVVGSDPEPMLASYGERFVPTSCWPEARRTASRCSKDARRSTAKRRPTFASTSSARPR